MSVIEVDQNVVIAIDEDNLALVIEQRPLLLVQAEVGPQGIPGVGAIPPIYTFRTQHTFAVTGPINSADVLSSFFVGEASSGQEVNLVKIRYRTLSGTVTFRLLLDGVEGSFGTAGSPLPATSTAATTSGTQALAEDDEIELDIINSTAGVNLSVTLIFEHVIT